MFYSQLNNQIQLVETTQQMDSMEKERWHNSGQKAKRAT